MIAQTSFDVELAFNQKQLTNYRDAKHVFVSGLARSGTTLLMRILYESGEFCSLTYRDMPFVLAPNLWSKITGTSKKHTAAMERAHGDGLLIDYDSPEALEEVFWRVFCSDQYLRTKELVLMSANDESKKKFRNFIDLVLLSYQGSRYLSKNNNNLLRLPSIAEAFPNAIILIPFRTPIQHANSLLNQHLRFAKQQKQNSFIEKYMGWLGHHEFGLDHRPFVFTSGNDADSYPTDTVEYWLNRWIDVYQYLVERVEAGSKTIVFFSYEQFCQNPLPMQKSLWNLIGVPRSATTNVEIKPSNKSGQDIENQLLVDKSNRIYDELSRRCEDVFKLD